MRKLIYLLPPALTMVIEAPPAFSQSQVQSLEEVVVTARRREENLQQVPIAITALSAEDLELRSIENTEDLQVLLPNVDIRGNGVSGGAAGSMAIRGIPGVARYVDGVHLSGNQGSLENVVELERIEVLRGPQGTYFGKNAIGGAIQYVTQKPQDEFGARFKATLGEFNRTDASMQANVLFDVLEGIPFGPMTPERYNAAGVQFTDELYAYGKREQYLNAVDYTGPGVLFESDFFSANLAWDINDSVTFRSITASRAFDYGNMREYDATDLVMFDVWTYDEVEETTQEFQFLGSGDRYSWVAGLYYFEEDEIQKFQGWQRWELTGMGAAGPRPRNALDRDVRKDTAIYAEITYDLTEKLTLTVGGRYSEEEFHSETYDPAEPLGPPQQPSFNLDGPIQVVGGEPLVFDVDFDALTPRVTLQNQFTDTVMGYISYAEGFNGGGVNSRFDPTLPNNGIIPFGDELLANIELGLRSDLLENRLRLNATYFTGTWDDIQIG